MSRTRLSVLMETEGTYPCMGGGVSTWCDLLCRRLSDVDFHLVALTGSPDVTPRYDLPQNVRDVHLLPLWGTEEPAEYAQRQRNFAEVFKSRLNTSSRVVQNKFIPFFEPLLKRVLEIEDPGAASHKVGTGNGEHGKASRTNAQLVHGLYRYFQRYDYKSTFRAAPTWEAFKYVVLSQVEAEDPPPGERPSAFDLVTALRWVYNFFLTLSVPAPQTDVTHATLAGFCGLLGVAAREEHGTPLLVTDHGIFARERYIAISAQQEFTFFAKRMLTRLSNFATRLCYQNADQVSPVCDYNRRWEVPLGADPAKLQTIHNGIMTDRFVPRPKPEKTQGRPTVVAATHVFPLKDAETMIRSCVVARERVPDVLYILYGSLEVDPPYTERCRRLVRELDLEDHFRFGGLHPRPAHLYPEGDISVLSSISEGFPYTVIESMACERPVVATDVGGVREALEGCGIIVPPCDAEALGNGVAHLLQEEALRQHMGRRGRERVLLRFRVDQVAAAYYDSYKRLVDEARAPVCVAA